MSRAAQYPPVLRTRCPPRQLAPMATLHAIVDALGRAAEAGESVVLATVVRVIGSSYGGVGARMLVRVDGSTVGLVSGGCLESDLADHARRVHDAKRAELVTYDARSDDDAIWGLGLGCNGLIEVLLEPLAPAAAADMAALLARALDAEAPCVLATVIPRGAARTVAHALLVRGAVHAVGSWNDAALAEAATHERDALAAGRQGLVRRCGALDVALETIVPPVRLVLCGSGPDVAPVVRFAAQLGWPVTVVDHRPVEHAHPERLPDARVVACADPARLADAVPLGPRSAAVVMSHHFARDAEYVRALLGSGAAYVGVLGPRARTERMLAELRTHGAPAADERLYGPVGLDLGGDGPEAIGLAIVSEVAAVMSGRDGGFLRDRRAPMHASAGAVARAR